MPLLDIGAAQAPLQNHLGSPRAYSLAHFEVPPCSFSFGNERRREPSWEGFQFPIKVLHTFRKSRVIVKVVPSLELKCSAGKKAATESCREVLDNDDTDNESVEVKSLGEDSEELDAKERTRRMRISKAKTGITAWNKGRKHSPGTIQRIKERTRLAMQDLKMKMKLVNLGHAQSEETRLKIAASVRTGWQKLREKQLIQKTCYYEWQNLIAEASRNGYAGEKVLQWNSYQILNEKLDVEWVKSVELRKTFRSEGRRGVPKSPEQRKKIAETIASKWADPVYRERVSSGKAKFYGTTKRAPEKPKEKPSGVQSRKQMKMKLANLGHAQSEETRLKIAASVQTGWQKLREKQLIQKTCYYEWQNLIAEASRNGYAGEEELQWNSYQILNEKLDVEWVKSVELRKTCRSEGSRGVPKSPEERKKIAEAIASKWADLVYRERVSSDKAKFYGTTKRAPEKPKEKPSGVQSRKQVSSKQKTNSTSSNSSKHDKCNPANKVPKKQVTFVQGAHGKFKVEDDQEYTSPNSC